MSQNGQKDVSERSKEKLGKVKKCLRKIKGTSQSQSIYKVGRTPSYFVSVKIENIY